jgi:beta-glucosidase
VKYFHGYIGAVLDPELKRYPKLSAKWYKQFLMGRRTSSIELVENEKDPSLVSDLVHLFE